MSNERCLGLSRERLIAGLTVAMLLGVLCGMAIVLGLDREEHTTYQAVIHISNWTNRTLNVTVYVFGNSWDVLEFTLVHTTNVTVTVTWLDLEETVAFIHCVAPDIYNTVAYTLEPGQWRSVMLI